MEKYAVVIPEGEKQKTGSNQPEACPDCGSPVEKKANVPLCPKDGTRPFEKKPE